MKKHILIILFCITAICSTYGQRGKEFWFAVPKITTGDGGADGKVRLVFTSYDQTTTINITQVQVPGFTPINITRTLPPNSSWEWNAGATYMGQLEVMANYPQPYALHMTADADFSVYYANITRNSEIYTLKGTNALGTHFIVPMQYEYISGSFAEGFNSIQILATEDSTKIDVELFKRTTHPQQTTDHQTITMYLDKGFCYAFHSLLEDDSPGIDHLYSTRIHSDKPIAVNSTDDSVEPGDLLGDQIVPVSLWGTSYLAVKNTGNIEKVYIFPSEDNTVVSIDGVAQPVMDLGGKMMIPLTTPATYISSNKKIMAWQITTATGSNELGGGMLPKLECTGSMETSYRRASGSTEIYFNIITHTDLTDAFTLNGQTGIITASDFTTVTGHPEWSYCRKKMDAYSGKAGMRLKNSKGYFHVAAYDNLSASCTFGYFSDYHDIRLNVVSELPNYTPGDIIHLYMTNASAFTDIQWTKPDGTVVNQDEITVSNPTAADAGLYAVSATSIDGCTIEEDGVVVVNFVLPSSDSTSVCQGENVELTAQGYAPYKWQPTSDTAQIINVQPTNTTVYSVNNGKIAENIVYNGNFQKNNTMFQSDYIYGGTSKTAVATVNTYSVWRSAREVNDAAYNRIYDHTTSSSTDGRFLIANCSDKPKAKIWTRKVDVIPNTQYEFAAWFIGAKRGGSKAKVHFSVNNEPVGDVIEMTDPGSTPTSTKWLQSFGTWLNTTGVTAEISIEVAEDSPDGAGVCIDDITFRPLLAITDTFTVNVVPMPNPEITGDTVVCRGQAVLDAGLFNGVPYSSYRWYDESGSEISSNQFLSVTSDGSYVASVNNNGCVALDTFTVQAGKELSVTVDSVVEVCGGEPGFELSYQIALGASLTEYSMFFDDNAKAVGFSDVLNEPLYEDFISIALPLDALAGTYSANIEVVSNSVCGDSRVVPVEITVKMNPNTLIKQKWNNVLALYNPDYNGGLAFTAYQWYKNGESISGETGSYLYLGSNLDFQEGDKYSVLLTFADSSQVLTCDFTPVITAQTKMATVVSKSQEIRVQTDDFNPTQAIFYNISGRIVSKQFVIENQGVITPGIVGVYILDLSNNREKKTYKVVVK